MRACHTISSKLTSSLCRIRDLLNMEGLPVGKDLLMQNMFPLASGKQKDREPGGLGSSQRKQVPWSPSSSAHELVDRALMLGRPTPSLLLAVFFFPLQMLFDKSNYTNFLPCGLKSGFDMMSWRNHYACSLQEKHHPAVYR